MFHSVCGFQGTCAYAPSAYAMGLSGLEPPTSRLSGVRSNRLSYKPAPMPDALALLPQALLERIRQPPALPYRRQYSTIGRLGLNHRVRDGYGCIP